MATISVSPFVGLLVNIIIGLILILLSKLNIAKFYRKTWGKVWDKNSFWYKFNVRNLEFIGGNLYFRFIGIICIIFGIIIFIYRVALTERIFYNQFELFLLISVLFTCLMYLIYRLTVFKSRR